MNIKYDEEKRERTLNDTGWQKEIFQQPCHNNFFYYLINH